MSLISQSRRDFVAKSIALGTGGLIYSTFGLSPLNADPTIGSRTSFVESLLILKNNISDQSTEMQDYLSHSEIVRSTSGDDFNTSFNDNYEVRHQENQSLVTTTSFARDSQSGFLGVSNHPWMWFAEDFKPA